MGDEVTKKELQAVQANLNKQIGDVKKLITEQKSDFNKDLEEENKTTVTVRTDLEKRMDGIDKRMDQFQDAINALAKGIGEVASKIKK